MGITGIAHWCYDSGSHHASRLGALHGQRKRPQHQEEAEVQELRGQGPAQEGRQGRKMPALRRDGSAVTGPATTAAPSGGVTPMSRRVMNLAHLLTQNARRHGKRVGLGWGERSWAWRGRDGR